MRAVTRERPLCAAAALAALLLVAAAPAGADLRTTDLDVPITDPQPTMNAAQLDTIARQSEYRTLLRVQPSCRC
jgi:hypothetical protein